MAAALPAPQAHAPLAGLFDDDVIVLDGEDEAVSPATFAANSLAALEAANGEEAIFDACHDAVSCLRGYDEDEFWLDAGNNLRAEACAAALAALRDGAYVKLAVRVMSDARTERLRLLVSQLLTALYYSLDPPEEPRVEGPSQRLLAQPEGASAIRILYVQAPCVVTAACEVLQGSLRRELEPAAREEHVAQVVQEHCLRLLRICASLEPQLLPGEARPLCAPAIQAGPLAAAVGAVLARRPACAFHVQHGAVNLLWAWLDVDPSASLALTQPPGLLPALLRLLQPLPIGMVREGIFSDFNLALLHDAEVAAAAEEGAALRDAALRRGLPVPAEADEPLPAAPAPGSITHELEMRREVQASACGSLWGACSRFPAPAVAAVARAGFPEALATLLLQGPTVAEPMTRFCAVSALAGWLSACAPDVPAALAAAWLQPGLSRRVAAMMRRGLGSLLRGGDALDEELRSMAFDWKVRDVMEIVNMMSRLISTSQPLRLDRAAAELAAGVCAWPMCLMLAPGARLLTAVRLTTLVGDPRLPHLLLALATSPTAPPAAAAVAQATLAHLASFSAAAAHAVTAAMLAPLRDFARAPADTVLLCAGEQVPVCAPLMAARSPFFEVLGRGSLAQPPERSLMGEDPDVMRALARWATTGGACAASLADALTLLVHAQRLLATGLAETMAGAACAAASSASLEELAAALSFGCDTAGPHTAAVADAAVQAAKARGLLGALRRLEGLSSDAMKMLAEAEAPRDPEPAAKRPRLR